MKNGVMSLMLTLKNNLLSFSNAEMYLSTKTEVNQIPRISSPWTGSFFSTNTSATINGITKEKKIYNEETYANTFQIKGELWESSSTVLDSKFSIFSNSDMGVLNISDSVGVLISIHCHSLSVMIFHHFDISRNLSSLSNINRTRNQASLSDFSKCFLNINIIKPKIIRYKINNKSNGENVRFQGSIIIAKAETKVKIIMRRIEIIPKEMIIGVASSIGSILLERHINTTNNMVANRNCVESKFGLKCSEVNSKKASKKSKYTNIHPKNKDKNLNQSIKDGGKSLFSVPSIMSDSINAIINRSKKRLPEVA